MPEADIETTAEEITTDAEVEIETGTEGSTEPEGKGGKAAVLADLAKERDARQSADSARKKAEAEATKAAKALAALQAKVKEFEDRDKTESQKLQEAIEAARKDAAELTAARDAAQKELMRYRIGMETEGFPASLIPRLQGDTEEEIAEDAKRLIEQLGVSKSIRKSPTTSSGLKSGASAQADQPTDKKEQAAAALRKFRGGS